MFLVYLVIGTLQMFFDDDDDDDNDDDDDETVDDIISESTQWCSSFVILKTYCLSARARKTAAML